MQRCSIISYITASGLREVSGKANGRCGGGGVRCAVAHPGPKPNEAKVRMGNAMRAEEMNVAKIGVCSRGEEPLLCKLRPVSAVALE